MKNLEDLCGKDQLLLQTVSLDYAVDVGNKVLLFVCPSLFHLSLFGEV